MEHERGRSRTVPPERIADSRLPTESQLGITRRIGGRRLPFRYQREPVQGASLAEEASDTFGTTCPATEILMSVADVPAT